VPGGWTWIRADTSIAMPSISEVEFLWQQIEWMSDQIKDSATGNIITAIRVLLDRLRELEESMSPQERLILEIKRPRRWLTEWTMLPRYRNG